MDPSQVTRFLALTSGIRKDDRYAGMTIKCGEAVFKLHKNIVCTQSKPLAAAFNGRFKESVDSTITLEDDEPEVVEGLIQYLYEQALDLKASEKNSLLMLTVKVSKVPSVLNTEIGSRNDLALLSEPTLLYSSIPAIHIYRTLTEANGFLIALCHWRQVRRQRLV